MGNDESKPIGKVKQVEENVRDVPSYCKAEPETVIYDKLELEPLYTFKESLDELNEEHTKMFKILVIGKTGTGKSRLINLMFNRKVLDSGASLNSITKDVKFVHADDKKGKDVIIMDTIGFNDSYGRDALTAIKRKVNGDIGYINCVIVVMDPWRRIQSELPYLHDMLKTFKHDEFPNNFVFVMTNSYNITKFDQSRLAKELVKMLNLKGGDVIFADFMPLDNDFYDEKAVEKKTKLIEIELKTIYDSINQARLLEPITL